MKKILVLSMGGTIDAEAYPDDENQYPKDATMNGQNMAFASLKDIYKQKSLELPPVDIEQIQICDKDSKQIDSKDIETLITHIEQDNYQRIVVTMGTDTMVKTAQKVQEHFHNDSKTPSCPVVFTGAIWPLANGPEKSDGYANLDQAAFLYGDRLTPEIYVTVGNIFMFASHVDKDFEAKKFFFKSPEV